VVEIMARIREQTGSPLVHEDLAAASHATNDLYRVLARISGRIGP
jgi:hypothetical protein